MRHFLYADPVFEWIYPDAVNRRQVIGPFFEIFTDAIAPYGVSQLVGDGAGATLWVPPGGHVVADEEAEAFFEEATSPDNCRLYERFGFEVIGEIVLPDGPTMLSMWRDPARVTVVPSSQL